MNMTKLILTLSLAIVVITMTTSNQPAIYASPTTEDDGWTEGDYQGSPQEQEQQAQDDWEAAGRPGDNNNDDSNNDSSNDNSDLPRCKLGVVVDCVLNDLGQTCEPGTDEDACQDIYGGVQGSPERDSDGQLINKPNPYCDTDRGKAAPVCHDRLDYDQVTGLYPCNDGTQKTDWKDCDDATKKNKDTGSNQIPSSLDPSICYNEEVQGCDIPECVNSVLQRCVIEEIGLICNPDEKDDPSNPSIVGGGHACQDIYAGTHKPEPEPASESELKTCGDGIVAVSCGVGRYSCSGDSGPSHVNDLRDCENASSSDKNTESESKPGLYTCNDGTQKANWRDCDHRADGSYLCSDGTHEVDLKACNIAARELKNNG